MTLPKRPDLSRVDHEIVDYIVALENKLQSLTTHNPKSSSSPARSADMTEVVTDEILEPGEPPSSWNLITASQNGVIKRTPRYKYLRQRRGGMGIFDLETHADDFPSFLTVAEEDQSLLIFTDFARVFRLPVSKLPAAEIRSRGEMISERLPFEPGERLAAILPAQATGYVALVSQNGIVRCLRHHLFGEYMKPGTSLMNIKETGLLAAACWTSGDADLFITTRNGIAIRFSEKLIPPKGALGMRISDDDTIAAVTSVNDSSGVFILSADGKGTLRLMSGFNPNKSAGGGGKIAMKANHIVAAFTVEPADDIFIISHLGKLIRFKAEEVSPTEGVVQGVICINLRADEATAAVRSMPQQIF